MITVCLGVESLLRWNRTLEHHRSLDGPQGNQVLLPAIERHGNIVHERSNHWLRRRLQIAHPPVVTRLADPLDADMGTSTRATPAFARSVWTEPDIDSEGRCRADCFYDPLGPSVFACRGSAAAED